MSKVMVLGISPLPFENEISLSGPGIRTWQFVKPVLEDGHEVCLVCLQSPEAYRQKISGLINTGNYKSLKYYSLSLKDFNELTDIQKIHDDFNPDCIFSLSSFNPSFAAVQLATGKPIWFDRGDLMAEAQIKAVAENDKDYLYNFWKLEEMVLERGDVFSAVSSPQRFSVIGRLGGAGRLNSQTLGYEFVYTIPCAIERGSCSHTKSVIRGKGVLEDDFVVLWSGGYNNWTDIDTLFLGLEIAMSGNSRIKFVSTGGEIPGQKNAAYARFLRLIDGSKYKDRFIMLGWVPTEDLENIYLESSLGINIDKYCYEVELGSRHRLLDWMKAGLPILTTAPSEFTRTLIDKQMAFVFPFADKMALADTILKLSSQKEILSICARRAKDFVQQEYTYEVTTEPFREWVKHPYQAPDNIDRSKSGKVAIDANRRRIESDYVGNLKGQINSLEGNIIRLNIEKDNIKQHIINLTDELDNAGKHSGNLEKMVQHYKNHIANLDLEREGLKNHIVNLNNHITNLEGQLGRIHNSKAYRAYKRMKDLFCLGKKNEAG